MTLFSSGLLETIVSCFQIIETFSVIPFKWNRRSRSFTFSSKTVSERCRLIAAYLCFFVTIGQQLWTWNYNNAMLNSFGIFTLATYAIMLSGCHLTHREGNNLVDLLNSMLSYEKRRLLPEGNRYIAERMQNMNPRFLKMLMWYNATSVVLLEVAYFFNIIVDPCMPQYPGSIELLDQCDIQSLGKTPDVLQVQLGSKIFVASISFFNWLYILCGMAMHRILIIAQGHCFSRYIELYGRKLALMENWDSFDLAKESSVAFREIQLMIAKHGDLNGSFIITPNIVSGIVGEIFSLFACIAFPMPTIVFGYTLWTVVVNASTFIFAYGCLGDVFLASTKSRMQIRSNGVLMKNRWFRRYTRSCPILRVSFGGSGNFIEPVTPLVIQQFVAENTVSLLLMQ